MSVFKTPFVFQYSQNYSSLVNQDTPIKFSINKCVISEMSWNIHFQNHENIKKN